MIRLVLGVLLCIGTAAAAAEVKLAVADGELHGSLLLPQGQGPFPAALIIAGSGPTDGDGNNGAMRNDSLKLLAEALAAAGYASVRYDKRGISRSANAAASEVDLRFEHFVDDAAAWLAWMAADPRLGPLAVIGHSEGALVGLLAAGQQPVAAYVSLAGAGLPAADILTRQLSQSLGGPLLEEALAGIDTLRQGGTVESPSPLLAGLLRPSVQPYLRSWFRHDPAELLAGHEGPALILAGSTDLQVGEADFLALTQARDGLDSAMIAGMNHVLKAAPAERQANIAAYLNPDLPLAEGLLEPLTSFLDRHLRPVASAP